MAVMRLAAVSTASAVVWQELKVLATMQSVVSVAVDCRRVATNRFPPMVAMLVVMVKNSELRSVALTISVVLAAATNRIYRLNSRLSLNLPC